MNYLEKHFTLRIHRKNGSSKPLLGVRHPLPRSVWSGRSRWLREGGGSTSPWWTGWGDGALMSRRIQQPRTVKRSRHYRPVHSTTAYRSQTGYVSSRSLGFWFPPIPSVPSSGFLN